MQWQEHGFILTTRKHGEQSLLVNLFTKEQGVHAGMLRVSKKQQGAWQIGNYVDATWKGRLSEHLGSYKLELLESNAAFMLSDPLRLSALHSACELLQKTLHERDPYPDIFTLFQALLVSLKQDQNWRYFYLHFEITLLRHLGFGLDFSECAATGVTEDLIYVSPKSGRAVCATAGEPYKEKLLPLPEILQKNAENGACSASDMDKGLAISGYFLDKYMFQPYRKTLPFARVRLKEMIQTQTHELETT